MVAVLRFSAVIVGAGAVTVSLFQLMSGLVDTGRVRLEERSTSHRIEFARVRRDSRVQHRQRSLPRRQVHRAPPEMPPVDDAEMTGPDVVAVRAASVPQVGQLELADVTLGARVADADEAPLVRVEPIYPMFARNQGVEGWVLIKFDIRPSGRTSNIEVVEAHPPGIFNRAAVSAVAKWKYRPRVVSSVATVTRGVTVRLVFSIKS